MSALPSPELDAAIRHGATILTPNQRAARTVRRAFDAAQRAAGQTLWTPPPILALDTWVTTLFRSLILGGHDARMLLNRAQQHSVWRTVVAGDAESQSLRSHDALADLAARAWRLLHLHGGQHRLREFAAGTDARAFVRWSESFARRTARVGWLTSAELPGVLTGAVSQLDLPEQGLVLLDFDELLPAYDRLIDAIGEEGFDVRRLHSTVTPPAASLYKAAESTAELAAAARWARTQLDADPETRIAIVVPNLDERRAEIDRAFASIVAPELQHIAATAPAPYEFSLGIPLAETALAAAGLALLRWPFHPLPIPAISALLVSPFFGGARGGTAAETFAAARFDAQILRTLPLLRPELSLAGFIALVRKQDEPVLGGLLARLSNLERAAQAIEPSNQTHTLHADVFRTLLEAAGWTRAAGTSSLTYQALQRWETTLDELSTLDFQTAGASYQDALSALERLAREAIYAPESRDAPIQILGPLELGGTSFDSLWFLGADDLTWPPQTATSPLLPFALQRALSAPGAAAARDQVRVQALTNRIAASASSVVFSFAARNDEGERRLSPLLAALNLPEHVAPAPMPATPAPPLTLFEDGASLTPPPPVVHKGGSTILQLQAACGFRAFAETRLFSSTLDTRELGLDARDRGNIVHDVMETFWKEVRDQQTLKSLTRQGRDETLNRAIDHALRHAEKLSASPWDAAYLAVQQQRLRDLLDPWLSFEATRTPFTVRDSEKKIEAEIGGLRLSLRVDRIDDTSAGPLIIDYKTGAANPGDWLTDRPDAPQLPLYAVMPEFETVGGVAFALLRAGKDLGLKGFEAEPGVLPKPARMNAATLEDQRGEWYDTLVALAHAYIHGDAAVAPKVYPGTCAYCAQRILCRFDPAQLEDQEQEDEANPDA